MVKITTYKGHNIVYENEGFYAKKGKVRKPNVRFVTESGVKEYIDNIKQENKKRKAEQEKKKKEEQLKKTVSKVKITLSCNKFKTFLTKCCHFKNEFKLKFTKTKLEVVAMDPANVVMFRRVMPCKSNLPFEVYINAHKLKQRLQHFKSKYLDLSFFVKEKELVVLRISGEQGAFEFPALQYDEREQKIPELKYDVSFPFEMSEFYSQLDIVNQIAESVRLTVEKGKFTFLGEGSTDWSSNEAYISKRYSVTRKKAEATAKFSLEYLRRKFISSKEKVTIYLKEDYPLKIEDSKGNWVILAPRVGE